MVLMLLVAVAAALGGWRRGRHRPGSGRRPKLRWWPVLLVAIAGQSLLALTAAPLRGALAAVDCAAVAMWCVLNQRSRSGLSGLPLLGAGAVLNCIAIAANGAMPVSRWALGLSGLGRDLDVTRGHLDKHIVMGTTTHLRWLGDVIPVPGLRTVVSAGDVLMLGGIAAAAFTAARHLALTREPHAGAVASTGDIARSGAAT